MKKNNFANIFRPFAQGSFVPFMVSADIALETGSRQDAGANSGLAWISLLGGALLAAFVILLVVYQRQKREAILARSDIEFRALSDSALAGIVQVDLTGKVRYANEFAARMFGLSPQELMQNGMARYASDPLKRKAMLEELQSAGQVRDYELDIQNARGENRHLLFSASLLAGVANVSLVDMTDRMLAEKELRRFSRVVSQMADTVVITDIEGNIEYVNPAFEELTGYSSAEALGKTPRILKSDHHNLEFYEGLWKTILKGEVFQDEIVNRKKNGEIYYETKTITPIRDPEGKIAHFVATAKDITARKQMEGSLRQKEAEFHLIADNTGDVIWVLDLESQRFTYVSPSVKKLRGLTPEEVMAQPMSASMTPGSMQKVVEELPARLELFAHDPTQSTYTDTLDQYRKDGSIVQIEVTTTFVRTEQDKIQVVGISRDITEKKLAAEMLLKSQTSLEHAQAIAHLGNWELEPQNGTGLFWSKEMYNLFQRDPLQGAPRLEEFMLLVHPDDREPLLNAQQTAIDTGAVVSIEYSAIPGGDEMRTFRASIQAIKNEAGQLLHLSGTVLDVTESHRMELEIRERVKELTCLFNVSRLLESHEIATETVCNQIIEYIIPAMQFPELTVPVLLLDDRRYTTGRSDEGLAQPLSAEIEVNGKLRGYVRVFYSADQAFMLPEEQDLLSNIARMLNLWFEDREAETAVETAQRELEELNRDLEKRVEERTAEVRRSEATYRALFENSNDGIFLMSPTGDEISANQQAVKMLGYTLEEYLALPPNAVTIPDQQMDANERFANALRGEHVPLYERTFISKDGKKVEVEINLSPIRDPSGKVMLVQSVVRDITERKKGQEALRESEEQNRLLFEESPDAITLLDSTGKILRANRAYEQLTMVPLDELLGNTAEDLGLVTPEMSHQLTAALIQAVSRNEPYASVVYSLTRPDHSIVDVESRIFLLRLGGIDCVLVSSRDTTERNKAEEALRENRDKLSIANAALEQASRLKDEFLASMSHELRTPLTGILGLSEAMQMQTFGALNERQTKALKNIETSGRHLLELINDILDLSKIEAGKLDMQFEPCLAADICQASLQLVKGMAHQKKQNISFSMNPISISIRADPRRLKQMLVNLLSNAVKFTPEGGELGLEVQTHEDLNAVSFSIWDKGIGIRPEDMGSLFKPFVQLDSSLARQYSGTGLGLSLVQRMAELQGGSITVESVPGEGSRFTIMLPWSPEATQPVSNPKPRDTGSLKNVMVIEDNELDAEHAMRYLNEFGIAFIHQPAMQGALEKAALLHPSTILLDLNLYDGSGLKLLKQIKADERTREIPIIITSVEERRTEAAKIGAIGYLVKPFSKQELRNELAKAAAIFGHPIDRDLVSTPDDPTPVVMIADDNEIVLELMTDFLEAKGCRVIATRSGFELLERVPEVRPDIMLVDIQMPGMDGMETMRSLRAHHDPQIAATPIIAVTALAMTGDREKCLQAGANEYMSKPVVLAKLVERIKEILEEKNRV